MRIEKWQIQTAVCVTAYGVCLLLLAGEFLKFIRWLDSLVPR